MRVRVLVSYTARVDEYYVVLKDGDAVGLCGVGARRLFGRIPDGKEIWFEIVAKKMTTSRRKEEQDA